MHSFAQATVLLVVGALFSGSSVDARCASSPSSAKAEDAAVTSRTGSAASSVPDGFAPGVKWQIAIQDAVDVRGGLQPADAKVMDVDLFLASKDPTLIPALHNAGVTVLCYFNAGAVQYTDCDWQDWTSDSLTSGKSVANYDQEKYVDITSDTVVQLHKSRIDLAHSIGCDGIDPDNIDTYQLSADESVGKQITEDDMVSFLSTIAAYSHSKTTPRGHPMMIGQKNAVELTGRISSFMDFAVSENCLGTANPGSNRGSSDEFCTAFHDAYVATGKPVFDIEYPGSLASGGGSARRSSKSRRAAENIDASQVGCTAGVSDADKQSFCGAGGDGISRILKLDNDQFGLNGCTQYCEDASSFVMPAFKSNETNSCCFGSQCS